MIKCDYCGRVRDKKLNNTNWKRHMDACKHKRKTTIKRSLPEGNLDFYKKKKTKQK